MQQERIQALDSPAFKKTGQLVCAAVMTSAESVHVLASAARGRSSGFPCTKTLVPEESHRVRDERFLSDQTHSQLRYRHRFPCCKLRFFESGGIVVLLFAKKKTTWFVPLFNFFILFRIPFLWRLLHARVPGELDHRAKWPILKHRLASMSR